MPLIRRQRWLIRGQVQGVGFRPFIYRLAREHQLTGFIRNDTVGVTVEVQGAPEQLDGFACALRADPPPLALIQEMTGEALPPRAEEGAFVIQPSRADAAPHASVTPDTAVCADCRRELFDPGDRRCGHALINCTHCGPRYSIIRQVPYDRPNTTMAGFAMCPACAREYAEVADRRFHAQPIACPRCGPVVRMVDPQGRALPGDPIAGAAERLARGEVVAIKGLGGFHLAVRADSAEAVGRLRKMKRRDAKPFALMVATLEDAHRLVHLGARAVAAMAGPECPIVLAPRRADAPVAAAVAPGNHRLGVMLPYTPLQQLVVSSFEFRVSSCRAADSGALTAGRDTVPGGSGASADTTSPNSKLETRNSKLPPLVMTSANQSDEPLVIDNAEAVERLGQAGLCDAILWHDRPIERCVEDSVLIDMGDAEPLLVRRSRGYVPVPLSLGTGAAAPGIALGGELKNTVAVVRDGQAILSQHLGDLTHPLALAYFRKAIDDLCDLFGVRPAWIAHDLHPTYLSTAYARELARRWGAERGGEIPLVPVQHHHAHAAAVLAEHGEAGPVLAVVCDGTGYGPDGTIWGGELLWADRREYRRLAHLRPLLLPGGDAAARDTRRCALALLHQALGEHFDEHPAARRVLSDDGERRMLAQMLRRNVHCAASSGLGRVFDGVAALLGLADTNQFEAQAAMRLEAAAWEWAGAAKPGPRVGRSETGNQKAEPNQGLEIRSIDLAPLTRGLLAGLAAGRPVPELAALFHDELAATWQGAVLTAAAQTGLRTAALSGGVFLNQWLTQRLTAGLEAHGLRVLRHRLVPPNDGGIALGQAAVAAARFGVDLPVPNATSQRPGESVS